DGEGAIIKTDEFLRQRIFAAPDLTVKLQHLAGNWHYLDPNLNVLGFRGNKSADVFFDENGWSVRNVVEGTNDSLFQQICLLVNESIYVFRAERLNLGACQHSTIEILAPDASNLPSVLLNLSTRKPHLWNEFLARVHEVFPW